MEQDFQRSVLSKAILTAVFAGIVATLLCIFFNVAFVESTGFPLHSFINVSTLIFGVNILFFAIGFCYYALIQIRKGELFFISLFILLTAFSIWRGQHVHRVADSKLNAEFKEQLSIIILIIGLTACVLLPVLFHSKKFGDTVV